MPNYSGQLPWTEMGKLLKASADNDGALGVAERTYVAAAALEGANTAILYPIPAGYDYLSLRFRGATNGHDATVDVWLGRSQLIDGVTNADLYRACTIGVEIGTQVATGAATGYTLLADELTVSNATTQSPIANAAAYQSANDSELMAQVVLPPAGCDILVVHGHTQTWGGNIAVDWTAFS